MQNLKKIDWVKWLIITLGVWLILYPHPYKVLVTILAIAPMITLIIHGIVGNRPSLSTLFNGVLDNTSSFSPVMHFGCSFIFLGFRIFMDYDPENMFVLIGIGLLSAFIPCMLLLLTHKLADKNDEMAGLNYVLLGVILLFYAPTSMFAINCVYDNTEPHVYPVMVIDKDKSRSSSKSGGDYYLRVTPWTDQSEPISIEVSANTYSNVDKGDSVIVYTRDGLLGVGWYYIEQ